ncbi:MAG: DinB family protein [Chloroflexota bacterium]|nr:DinB family protein [Chloroflexota bacterium]
MTDRTEELIGELTAAREDLLSALDGLAPALLEQRALIGDWGARELIAHLGYWAGHAVEAIHAVETGRADEFGADRPSVEDINATVARVARQTDLATVRRREAASVEAFVERLGAMDPALLDVALPHHGLTLVEGIREDGAAHYREHAAQLRDAGGVPP